MLDLILRNASGRLTAEHPRLLFLPLNLLLVLSTAARAQDRVVILGRQDRELTRSGTVLEYDVETLVLQTSQSQEIKIPSRRVVRVEPKRSSDHETAERLFEQRDFKTAQAAFQRAFHQEKRNWLRREILAQIVRCHTNLREHRSAGSTFLLLYRDDPLTMHFDAIPLAWRPWQPDRRCQTEAQAWLQPEQPSVARLIGASWLLSTAKRPDAIRVLEQLKRDRDPRVQQLAITQLWRTQLVTTRKDIVMNDWPRALAKMPFGLRGGPYFVFGRALAKHGETDRSILELMRVPILYDWMYDLAGESLWEAGQQLDKAGSQSDAVRIYREIMRDYTDTSAAVQAQERVLSISQRG